MTTPGLSENVDIPIPPDEASLPAEDTVPVGDPATPDADAELRTLVQELIAQSQLGFDPATMRKGIITVINPFVSGTPTVDLTLSGDDTVTVPAVRFLDSYSPVVGDNVILMKQGADIVVLGRIAIGTSTDVGWIQAALAAGFAHDSNTGNLMYRRVWDNGCWKVQFKGGIIRTSGNTIISALATDYRPSNTVVLVAARDDNGGAPSVKIRINTSGSVVLESETFVIPGYGNTLEYAQDTGTVGGGGTATYAQDTGFAGTNDSGGMESFFGENTAFTIAGGTDHAHGAAHVHNGPNHAHAIGAHSHTYAHLHPIGAHSHGMGGSVPIMPSGNWVSLHGLEYYVTL